VRADVRWPDGRTRTIRGLRASQQIAVRDTGR
jgi:hypothetical protein